jgi:hypothetical protein
MTEKERNMLLKAMAKRKKTALKSKGSAISYLHKIGILTKSGNTSSAYKDLCIPAEQV